jgi:hypothetical protein
MTDRLRLFARWAREMAARYRRALWRRHPSARVLLRRRATLATVMQNSLAFSCVLRPLMRLAVVPSPPRLVAIPVARVVSEHKRATARLGRVQEGQRVRRAPARLETTVRGFWGREPGAPAGATRPRSAWRPSAPASPPGGQPTLRRDTAPGDAHPLVGRPEAGTDRPLIRQLMEERRRIERRVEQRLERRVLDLVARPDPAQASRPDVLPGGRQQGVVEGAPAPHVLSPAQAHARFQAQVESLADEVLRQIDRRFTAYRERLGRVF